MSEPAQEMWFSQTIHTYKPYWLSRVVIFEFHGILMLGKSPIKWRQCPNMTIAVDWDVKHQIKQTNKQSNVKPQVNNCWMPEEEYSTLYQENISVKDIPP